MRVTFNEDDLSFLSYQICLRETVSPQTT